MKTASGLGLVAVGAILAFAVTAHTPVLNVQVAGWVLILIGLAGLFVPQRGYGWLRQRMVVRSAPRRVVRVRRRPRPTHVTAAPRTVTPGAAVPDSTVPFDPDPMSVPDQRMSPSGPMQPGSTEVSEEFIEE